MIYVPCGCDEAEDTSFEELAYISIEEPGTTDDPMFTEDTVELLLEALRYAVQAIRIAIDDRNEYKGLMEVHRDRSKRLYSENQDLLARYYTQEDLLEDYELQEHRQGVKLTELREQILSLEFVNKEAADNISDLVDKNLELEVRNQRQFDLIKSYQRDAERYSYDGLALESANRVNAELLRRNQILENQITELQSQLAQIAKYEEGFKESVVPSREPEAPVSGFSFPDTHSPFRVSRPTLDTDSPQWGPPSFA